MGAGAVAAATCDASVLDAVVAAGCTTRNNAPLLARLRAPPSKKYLGFCPGGSRWEQLAIEVDAVLSAAGISDASYDREGMAAIALASNAKLAASHDHFAAHSRGDGGMANRQRSTSPRACSPVSHASYPPAFSAVPRTLGLAGYRDSSAQRPLQLPPTHKHRLLAWSC
ncbi:expressed protein [Chlorella variabilis]|uniref:Expressed protein n=1 Tax=Chlorella variabilis TaxID=554065 RepID=E1ZAE3_CHLVA|nr:expressed protein [Chlorella variabilis]EFN57245.1 expressed protein [Chlorella variabilis]|eukprot:XP_005849347.1 expressed protein [Chlorella variabilis]